MWDKKKGLPDDIVTSVLQAKDGYLWVGTASGLARFDGVRFVPFTTAVNVTSLCEDGSGRLWIGTQRDGLLVFAEGEVRRFQPGKRLLERTINSIAQDTQGGIWIATPNGLYRVHGEQIIRYSTADGLPNDFVTNVSGARSGTVWITTRGGICQFKDGRINAFPFQTDSPGRSPESLGVYEDRQGNLWAFGDTYLVNLNEGKHLNHFGSGNLTSSTRIWSLCEGSGGELWIGTSGKGLYCFADNQFVPVSLGSGGLDSDVRALCEDREGNLWLATHGSGLARLQRRNMRLLTAGSGLPDRPANSLAIADGRAWAGFERGGIFWGTAENLQIFANENSVPFQTMVSSLAVAEDSSLWVATPGAGLFRFAGAAATRFTTAHGLSDDRVFAVAADVAGAIWAGTASGTVHRFEIGAQPATYGIEEGLPAEPVTTILTTPAGELWVGYANGGVFSGTNGLFHPMTDPPAFDGKAIRSMHVDEEGRLWVGTSFGQLGCLANGRFKSWDINPGNPEHAIWGIVHDRVGDLWLSTANAVYRLNRHEISSALAGVSAVRPQLIYRSETISATGPNFGWPKAVRTGAGELWFALAGGIAVFDLRSAMLDRVKPPILIEEVAVNNTALPWETVNGATLTTNHARTVRLASDLQSLRIQFTALRFSEPEKIRFRHRLDGFDPGWVRSGGGSRYVEYGRLPYGRYTFRVQAGLQDDAWFADEAVFDFEIPVPLWRTAWAIGFYSLAGVVGVACSVRIVSNRRFRRRLAALAQQQAMERERMRIAQDMHDEIGSKLTKISFMSERAKGEADGNERVAEKLDSIARTSRDLLQSLDEIVWAVNPHNDTLEHLAAYLGQYATEYLQNTSVQCELRIARGLPDHPLSAEVRHNLFLAFEESLNNALKHGEASRIQIDMYVEGGRFTIRVADNGRGFEVEQAFASLAATPSAGASSRRGNGLRNMQARLDVVGGRFDMKSEPGKGTVVTFSVPLART